MDKLSDFLSCVYGGGNFVLLALRNVNDKRLLIQKLISENIYVRDVSQTKYLEECCVRVTIGTCEQMAKVAKVIFNYFEEKK